MPESLDALLETADREIESRWPALEQWLAERFGSDVSIESILFLIGVQSRGIGFSPKLEKEAKQELIMEGSYIVLETLGHYERTGMDEHERWSWEHRVQLPAIETEDQEKLLRLGILRYFEQFVDTL